SLARKGEKVYVLTQGSAELPAEELINGVHVLRADSVAVSANNFVDNILHLNFQLLDKAIQLYSEIKEIDIIHGHDWLVFWACKVLKHSLKLPLIYTIHATEYGRNHGIYNDLQRYINDLEWYATFEAWKVIVCSQYMNNEVRHLFQLPEDKVITIPNGVNPENFRLVHKEGFRENYASFAEDVVFYVGRLVREKGIQVLIQAIPEILKTNPSTKFIIAGKGPFLENLRSQAEYLGIADRIYFTGFIDDEDRNRLYQIADVAVFPSLYEPFGIVALEAMVTKTPLVVSNVGELAEFVHNGENGFTVNPNDPGQLAEKICYILNNKKKAADIADRAYQKVIRDFSWNKIAGKTMEIYEDVLYEYLKSDWTTEKEKNKREKSEENNFVHRYASSART
ncbi:MAG: glycosyltransferase family 4 protein, partial [Halanaerobiaceae bacterium]|nr:glycosyltransferase family 4 protein [Halanaerobiaceae bacterium]